LALPKLSSRYGKKFLHDAQHWKRVHSLTEKLYKKFLELRPYLTFCEEIYKRGYFDEAEDSRITAELILSQMRNDIENFGDELKKLPRSVSRTGPIVGLIRISSCYYALKQGLASPLGSDAFTNGIGLSERIEDWLYIGLHIADRVLEEYFALPRV
jgi:hypothetical protein